MPDDERLGGTRDPHEYGRRQGRRHSRDEPPPPAGEEKPRRRRRSMEASGGLSVADLVQKHTASRSDLTPIDPQQLQQNGLMSGRRARQDRQGAEGPAGRGHPGEAPRRQAPPPPSIADALGGSPDFPRDDAPRPGRRAARNGFPPDDAPRRTPRPHPGEAARNGRRAAEVPGETSGPRSRRAPGEGSGHHALPPDAPNSHHAYPPEAPANGHRAGEGPAHRSDAPANGHHAFPPEAPANGHRAGEGSAHHFPPDAPPSHRAGETSAHHAFPPDAPPRGNRRTGEASAHHAFPPDAPGEGSGPRVRRAGEASAHHALPPEPRPRNGREASAHHPIPGQPPAFPVGEASAHHPIPGDGSSPRPRRAPRRAGEPAPFPPEGPRNGHGEASAHLPIPGPGRRPGEASAHHAIPGEPPRNGREASAHHVIPGEAPAFHRDDVPRNGREASAHHAIPGQPPVFPRDDAPRNGRRPGEASAHYPVPGQPSNRFPVGDPRRQGPPTPPPPGRWPEESEPRLTPAAIDAPDARPKTTGVPPVPPPLPPRGGDDLVSMTTEMEAIGEEVQKRRTIDHTLARFSAVHDEIKAEEREKKAKRRKLMPWQNDDSEMDHLDELEAQQSMAMHIPPIPADDEEVPEDRKRKKKARKKKLRGRNAGKAFVIVVAALVFASTAAGWSFISYFEAGANTVDALDPDSKAIQDAAAQVGDENFLLVGSDTRAGASAEDGVGDESTVEGARSDTVMIAHIPKNRERVVVVSFPRDLEVNRPDCEGWDPKTGELNGEQHPGEEQVKLNTAYQVGGPKCVTKMVQELSGLAINHFVGIDFHGFKDMVDAVEGVEVCVEKPMKDEVLGTIVPQAGKNVRLTGDQALNFVRARHVLGDVTSDYGRIIRQQRFLSSLLRKAMSSEVLLDPGKLTGFVDAFSKATFGDNIGVDQLFTLGQSMQEVEAGKVTFITVPTTGYQNERHNEELLVENTDALFEAIRQDVPLPGEAPAKKPADDASKNTAQQSTLAQDQPQGPVDPKTVKIQVLNGGNPTGGIAGRTADALGEYGFQIMRVDSAPEAIDKPAIIRYSKERAAEAQTVQAAVPGSVLVEDPSMAGAIMLVVGPGFDGEVVSPNGGGKTAEVPDNLSTVNAGDGSCA